MHMDAAVPDGAAPEMASVTRIPAVSAR